MAGDRGARYITLIQTAKSWGLRPSALILGEDGMGPWSKWDIVCAQAFDILQSERCGQCGYPLYLCRNESEDIQFRIEERSCAAMVAKDRYENPPHQNEPRKIGAGVEVVPIAYTLSGSPLSDFREPYYKALAKKSDAERVSH